MTAVREKITRQLGTIILVGLPFDESEATNLLSSKVITFEDSFSAYQYAAQTDELIGAFLVSIPKLEKEKNLLIKNIQQNPKTWKLPVFGIYEKNEIQSFSALPEGIDDCFILPIDWKAIEEKMAFFQTYKPLIVSYKAQKEPQFQKVHMPVMKRVFDIVMASFFILLFSPFFIIIPALIYFFDRGPIVYKSKRIGTGYEMFDFLKFRSMYTDADKRVESLKKQNQYGDDNPFFKIVNDPRITPIGRWIRKTSLDEIPQFFNVLKGDMSIVGNRPLPLYEAQMLTRDQWSHRFLAPAGITGLWQVSKRGKGGELSAEERINLDIDYANKYSFWFDLKILFMTIPAMLQSEDV